MATKFSWNLGQPAVALGFFGREVPEMAKKNTRNTKGRIIAAAWKLFYEQGYEETTVEDIVFESETSKGSFYHYFREKTS